ncbi:NAD(P)-dependent oxidoreductase [bacterium]|nr:NAD(P)-dependent oxidoreductase [bacterium]
MRILVTGGAGYVGTRLCNYLYRCGHDVIVFDNMTYGNNGLLENIVQYCGDITNPEELQKAMVNIDTVYHLAAISNDPTGNLDEAVTEAVNYIGSINVLDAAENAGVKQFIFASSSSVLGIQEGENVTEETEPNPITVYSRTKLKAEKEILAAASDNFITTAIRPATICGVSPRQRFDLVINNLTGLAFFEKKIIIHGGDQRRPNLTMEEMLRIYRMLIDPNIDHTLINGQVFNAGWDNMTVRQMAELVASQVACAQNKPLELVQIETEPAIDQRDYHITSKKIETVLGFIPKYKVSDAVSDLVQAMSWGFIPNMTNDNYYNLKVLTNR